jgi:hypothetical protein
MSVFPEGRHDSGKGGGEGPRAVSESEASVGGPEDFPLRIRAAVRARLGLRTYDRRQPEPGSEILYPLPV